MRPLSEHLTDLSTIAEEIIRRGQRLPTEQPRGFAELAAEIYRADASPSVGERSTFAGVIVCKAIEAIFAGLTGDDHYLSTIGHELPRLRREAWQAMKNEKAAREEDTRR